MLYVFESVLTLRVVQIESWMASADLKGAGTSTSTGSAADALRYDQSQLFLSCESIRHGFFKRTGGVSTGVYGSLNCGFGGDDPQNVFENRRRAILALCAGSTLSAAAETTAKTSAGSSFGSAGAPAASASTVKGVKPDLSSPVLVMPTHSHGGVVLDVTASNVAAVAQVWALAAGATKPAKPEMHACDAVVTALPNVWLGVLGADCAPLLFVDPMSKVIAAAHCGSKPVFAGIIENVLQRMVTSSAAGGYACALDRIRVCLGPALGPNSYEVDPPFRDDWHKWNGVHPITSPPVASAVAQSTATSTGAAAPASTANVSSRCGIEPTSFFKPKPHTPGKLLFDLPGLIVAILKAAGIPPANIDVTNAHDSFTAESDWFSYRRNRSVAAAAAQAHNAQATGPTSSAAVANAAAPNAPAKSGVTGLLNGPGAVVPFGNHMAIISLTSSK